MRERSVRERLAEQGRYLDECGVRRKKWFSVSILVFGIILLFWSFMGFFTTEAEKKFAVVLFVFGGGFAVMAVITLLSLRLEVRALRRCTIRILTT